MLWCVGLLTYKNKHMQKITVSYDELAKRVGDMILANNLPNEIDTEWWCGLIEQPLMREHLDAIDDETRTDMQSDIANSKDEAEKAKLTEELAEWEESGENASIIDTEIYQTYIITGQGAEYLFNHTSEIISYSEKLGLWFWHMSHWGTAWSGVHTYIVDDIDYEKAVYGTEAMIKYSIG